MEYLRLCKTQRLFALSVLIFLWIPYRPCLGHYKHQSSNSQASSGAYFGEYNQQSYQEEIEYLENNYNPYHGERVVDNKGRYILEWTVDYKTKMITFNMTVATTGWVGLGLSKDGSMKNADIMVGWVGGNGKGYLMDLHSDQDRKLKTDAKQTWKLLASSENNGITYLLVNRPLDTCDPYDFPITIDLAWLLWAYGETDELEYHFDKRGSFPVHLMDPVLKSHEPHLEVFRVSNEVTLNDHTTTYHCSIHKGPHLLHKQHMVEFHPYFENTLSVNHTHHLLVWRCVAPPGMNAKDIFEPLLDYPGEECYFNDDNVIPIQLCRVIVTAWGIGGNPYILPHSTGIPFGESFDEYFMLEVHFNNPEALPLQLNSGMDIYYTNRLRANDGGVVIVGYDLLGLIMVPPISQSFNVYGFCTEDCSKSIVPNSGFEIIGVGQHTHYSGRRLKLQHFRNGRELEYIIKDDNFDSVFQQQRVLYEPRLVMPGDLLVMKCEYDDTWTNVTVVSGFSTREEMCLSVLTITKRIPYYTCDSQVPPQNLLSLIGVEDVVWDIDSQERFITAPPALAGQPLSYVTDTLTDWTKSLRYKLQEAQLSSVNTGNCPQILLPTPSDTSSTTEETATQEQRILGTIISSSADPADILTLAKGYGVTTLMGDNTMLPNRLPGPFSSTAYPSEAEKYTATRNCPRVKTAPFPYYSTQYNNNGPSSGTGGSYQSYPSSG